MSPKLLVNNYHRRNLQLLLTTFAWLATFKLIQKVTRNLQRTRRPIMHVDNVVINCQLNISSIDKVFSKRTILSFFRTRIGLLSEV